LISALALIAGDAHPRLAEAIASATGITVTPACVSAFADGETRVRIEGEIQDADLYIVQPTSPPTNETLMNLALLADAARGAGASRITAVLPYFGYARQDTRRNPGEPRSGQLAARILRCAGIDRAVVLELHSPALESAFDIPLLHLQADEIMLPDVRGWGIADLVVVSPDAGGLKRAQRYASALRGRLAVIVKSRPGPDAAIAQEILGDVRDRDCLIVDDMASTGQTLVAAAELLARAGAREIHALFIHAIMAPGALERICAGPLRRIVTTDSVPAALDTRVQVISIAPLLARTVGSLARRQ
jgi:ribose-phosphate pyrophosphokinase